MVLEFFGLGAKQDHFIWYCHDTQILEFTNVLHFIIDVLCPYFAKTHVYFKL